MGPVNTALVLAAGNGDVLRNPARGFQLLQPVHGRPLIVRTIETAREAGITQFEIVLGYRAERVRAAIERHVPADIALHFTLNPDWHLGTGVSALAAESRLPSRFALLTGDHLFEARVLEQLLLALVEPGESLLALDARSAAREIASDARNMRLIGSRVVSMTLAKYDLLDTGPFVCARSVFGALEMARVRGETTLSGGIRILVERGLMRAVHVGDSRRRGVDTIEDLQSTDAITRV